MRRNPKEIIRSFKQTGSADATALNLGVHRVAVCRWIKRSRSVLGRLQAAEKYAARKPTRPQHIRSKMTRHDAARELREKTGWGTRKIVHVLRLTASHMTAYRYLKGQGLVRKSKRHRRPWSQDAVHMHVKNTSHAGYLQMDVEYITPELSGLPWTYFEFAVIDIFLRCKDAVIFSQLDQDRAVKALGTVLERLPFKAVFVQTDNGLEFQERFKKFCLFKGLGHRHIHKRTPNENAVIERSFRTDEEELFFRQNGKPKDCDEQQVRFSDWLRHYSRERPHLGINLKTPLEVIAADVVLR